MQAPGSGTTARLEGCYVISLRPAGRHAALRRAAARRGARLLALSPWRIEWLGDAATRHVLDEALRCPTLVFTSPEAVRAADALLPLHKRRPRRWLAVGGGTAAALAKVGIAEALSPTRADSEGLLALPELASVAGDCIGLVTAPGGRGAIAPALYARGASITQADVYRRVPITPPASALARLRALDGPAWLLASSAQAITTLLARLAPDDVLRLRAIPAIAASPRIAETARQAGLHVEAIAAGADPQALVDAVPGPACPR